MTTATTTALVDFLTARYTETDLTVDALGPEPFAWVTIRDGIGQMAYTTAACGKGEEWWADGHVIPHVASAEVIADPAVLAADLAAKWQVLAHLEKADDATAQKALRLLAGAFKTHDDYDPAWAVVS